jgi:tRNA1(Val) A37 N6-methylase TrmN6
LTACHKLLNHHGELFLLYPLIDERALEVILNQAQFSLRALTQIRATESKAPHLHIIQAKAMPENTSQYLQYENCETKTIVHYESDGKLSQEAAGYLQEYYSILP